MDMSKYPTFSHFFQNSIVALMRKGIPYKLSVSDGGGRISYIIMTDIGWLAVAYSDLDGTGETWPSSGYFKSMFLSKFRYFPFSNVFGDGSLSEREMMGPLLEQYKDSSGKFRFQTWYGNYLESAGIEQDDSTHGYKYTMIDHLETMLTNLQASLGWGLNKVFRLLLWPSFYSYQKNDGYSVIREVFPNVPYQKPVPVVENVVEPVVEPVLQEEETLSMISWPSLLDTYTAYVDNLGVYLPVGWMVDQQVEMFGYQALKSCIEEMEKSRYERYELPGLRWVYNNRSVVFLRRAFYEDIRTEYMSELIIDDVVGNIPIVGGIVSNELKALETAPIVVFPRMFAFGRQEKQFFLSSQASQSVGVNIMDESPDAYFFRDPTHMMMEWDDASVGLQDHFNEMADIVYRSSGFNSAFRVSRLRDLPPKYVVLVGENNVRETLYSTRGEYVVWMPEMDTYKRIAFTGVYRRVGSSGYHQSRFNPEYALEVRLI